MKKILKISIIILLFNNLFIISLEEGSNYQASKRQRLEQKEIENVVSINNFDFDDELFNELLDLDFSELYQDSFIHNNVPDQDVKNQNVTQPAIKNSSALYVSSRRLKHAFSHPSVIALTLDKIVKKSDILDEKIDIISDDKVIDKE
ncbi:hypothetical protein [Candidatus Chromulinivorax destructor]|uniref:Uncharacterized protein n=1 Tax=Candidatus Chromulinivorax destructor TaxID=2066483 RepID=A0A345ZA93_9BACT|nr:hypothetical protein [Candidatus Chromulinivorax destructor]AXK60210.1 hypothetical protein C0J27_00395 [Candidatus Chromulinivorax destructor]